MLKRKQHLRLGMVCLSTLYCHLDFVMPHQPSRGWWIVLWGSTLMTLCWSTWMIYLCSVPLNMSMKIIWGLFSSNWGSISCKPNLRSVSLVNHVWSTLAMLWAQGRYMWTRTRLLLLLIGNHPRISREFSSFWALPTTTIDSSLILLRWLPPLVIYSLIRRNSSGIPSSNVLLTLEVAVNFSTCVEVTRLLQALQDWFGCWCQWCGCRGWVVLEWTTSCFL